jgi:hypothetical protein
MTRRYSSTSVETTLSTGISSTATTMVVATGTGSTLLGNQTLGPAVGGVYPDQFTLAIDPDTANEEIVFATFLASDTFTIVRARAGTSGITHSGGATVKHVLTSSDLDYYTSGVDNAVTLTGTQTLTNKDLSSATNTLSTSVVTLTGSQTLTNKTLTVPKINIGYSAKTAAYTLASGDENYLFSMNNASTAQFNIPTDATFNFAIGTQISFVWIAGAGQPTIGATTPGTTTVTSNAAVTATPKLTAIGSAATAIKLAANSWLVVGDIA